MADEQTTTPNEEQVKLANDAETAKWEDDFKTEDLAIPYKREDEEEIKAETEEEAKTTEEEEENEPVQTYSDPEPVVTIEDPGEYKPADYSFEVVLKDGKAKKISTPEQAEELADDPDNFETPKQLMDFINKQNKMNIQLDKDKDKWEQSKNAYEQQTETATERQNLINDLASGFQYLTDKGLIPKVSPEHQTADWFDPEIAKQPGIKEYHELTDYMIKENGIRSKAGIAPLGSIVDAYNAMQLETSSQKKKEETKAAGEARKAAGARVAGSSPAQQGSYVPKGIAVGNPNVFKRSEAIWDN